LANARIMRMLFILALAASFILGIYEARHAHAGEPSRCGFWGSMEAGMSCR
jgi:hypothetical protein